MASLLRRLTVWRTIREATRPKPAEVPWIQYGCRFQGHVITIYPSVAAMENDPIFTRGNGARSVGREMRGGLPVSGWRPVFSGDLATHRYQAGSDD